LKYAFENDECSMSNSKNKYKVVTKDKGQLNVTVCSQGFHFCQSYSNKDRNMGIFVFEYP